MKDGDTEVRSLARKLTDSEMLERAATAAEAELAIEDLKLTRVQIAADIREHSLTRLRMCHVIDAGEEARDVSCRWHADYAHNVWRLVADDSAEEVDTRPMVAADRQLGLVDTAADASTGPGVDMTGVAPSDDERAALGASGGGDVIPIGGGGGDAPAKRRGRARKTPEQQPEA